MKAWGDDPVNTDACIYTETDGITRVTTEPGLQKLTKCYKQFRCTGGATVQAKMNQMGMGVRQRLDSKLIPRLLKIFEFLKNFYAIVFRIKNDAYKPNRIPQNYSRAETLAKV